MEKILIVDDSEMNRSILTDILGPEYDIIEAENGLQAVATLQQKQEEISRYGRLKTTLYESLADGLIDKAEYLELKSGYDMKIADAEEAAGRLKKELEALLQNRAGNCLWIEQFKKYQNITELTRHIAVTLIERITVFEDSRIEIRFRYQYDFERALGLVRNMEGLCPESGTVHGKGAV